MRLTISFLVYFGLFALVQCRDLSSKEFEEFVETERKEVCVDDKLECYYGVGPEQEPDGIFEKFFEWAGEKIDSEWWRSRRENVATQFRFWQPNSNKTEVITNYDFHLHFNRTREYNKDLKAYFIIHGYQGGDAPWALEMKDALMQREPCHVFIVDWSEGDGLLYGTARENIWVVGAETGRFIERVAKMFLMHPRQVHLIGHSLGAHTAGLASKWLKYRINRVGRITGLDPAGPDFYEAHPTKRLDRSDAPFVDVIHTNWAHSWTGGLGILKPIGHFDFYPNGGADQPGCPTAEQVGQDIGTGFGKTMLNTLVSGFAGFGLVQVQIGSKPKNIEESFKGLACSHGRAYEFFIESIKNSECRFMADECLSWDEYESGNCRRGRQTPEVEMGFHAGEYTSLVKRKESRKFYLNTNAAKPYCKQ